MNGLYDVWFGKSPATGNFLHDNKSMQKYFRAMKELRWLVHLPTAV